MGQTFSRGVVRNLERGMDKYRQQMKDEAMRDIAAKQTLADKMGTRFTDPNALQTGFMRGEGAGSQLPVEIAQEAFLRQEQDKAGGEKLELEPDLIKFLEDIGPLQKVVDPEFTSPRLVEHWKQQEQQKVADAKQQLLEKKRLEFGDDHDGGGDEDREWLDRTPENEHRLQQVMPLMQDSEFTIARSTNFSTTVYAEDTSLGVTDLDLFGLLRKQAQAQQRIANPSKKNTTTTTTTLNSSSTAGAAQSQSMAALAHAIAGANTSNSINNSPVAVALRNELVANFTQQHYQRVGYDDDETSTTPNDASLPKKQELLRRTLQVLQLPSIMKDEDGFYFGVWPDRVEEIQITSKLQLVPNYKIRLVLADITDTKLQNEREQEQAETMEHAPPEKFSTRRRGNLR